MHRIRSISKFGHLDQNSKQNRKKQACIAVLLKIPFAECRDIFCFSGIYRISSMQMGCFCSQSQHSTDDFKEQKETNRRINNQLAKEKHEYKSTHRLLLLGMLKWKISDTIFLRFMFIYVNQTFDVCPTSQPHQALFFGFCLQVLNQTGTVQHVDCLTPMENRSATS